MRKQPPRMRASRLERCLAGSRREWAIRAVYAARLEQHGRRIDPPLPHDVYLTRADA